MELFFTFENTLPSREADAEVFITTARYLGALASGARLHIPVSGAESYATARRLSGMPVLRAYAPLRPAALRHLCCGLTVIWRREFRAADVVYTRNLWVAWLALLAGQRVVFDHYRPWPAQIPPLRPWLYRLFRNKRLLANITHSEYTRKTYLGLGISSAKLFSVHNGFEPSRITKTVAPEVAKSALGIDPQRNVIVYTGRINKKKGLELVLEAARRLPGFLFLLVGSYGPGEIETAAAKIENVRVIPWQAPETLPRYLSAADILLIPPSLRPFAEFGSTVLPLKLFFYMGSGRPILAGDTPDVREVLHHDQNAFLCRPDCSDALVAAITTLATDDALARRLAANARVDSRHYTWNARAEKIAAIIEDRLQATPDQDDRWDRAQFSSWVSQSWRWIVHLVRTRSWVLPPREISFPAER